MSRIYLRSPLPPFTFADGTPLATSTTLTDISPTPQKIPAQQLLLEVGTEFELNAYGQFSTTGTPTLLLGFYWGGVAGIALAASIAAATATGAAAFPWVMYYRGRIRTVGATGSIVGQGFLQLGSSLTAMGVVAIPGTAALRTVAIDTTASGAKPITVGAQWGTSSASNTITCNDFSVDVTN